MPRNQQAWRARTGRVIGRLARALIAAAVVTLCVFVAGRFGLVALIASGYRALALIFLAVYVAPLMTIGIVRLFPREAVP